MVQIETNLLTCICKFEYKIFTERKSGHVEDEEWYCPNCGYPHSFRASMPIQNKDCIVLKTGIIKQSIDLDPRIIFDILKKKGAEFLYHANTALTSLTFLQRNKLLSRQYVSDNDLKQTSQYTDKSDFHFGINNDIFMDVIDIHAYARDRNKYGPVLFVFPLDLLKTYPFIFVRITKCNPSDWNDKMPLDRKYYTSEMEFSKSYELGNFSAMLMFHHLDGQFPLDELIRIKIDAPNLGWGDKFLHEESVEHFKTAVTSRQGKLKVNFRKCRPEVCNCHSSYENLYGPICKKMFSITEAE